MRRMSCWLVDARMLAALVIVASLAAVFPARAETEVITVSARKIDESLQSVPVTVQAISRTTLVNFNYDQVSDIVARVPALNVQVGGSGSGGQISLRGVGSSNITAAFDSAVALDFDGIQVSTMRILQSTFFDMQQIEVLKGPQSLFFGKSATAGVVSLKSANPTDEFEVSGKLAYEFEEQGYTVEAYASGPIGEKVGFRIAARYNNINKFLYNDAPVVNKKRGEENINVRGTLQFDPADNFSANLKLNYIRQENDGAIRKEVQDCGANGVADPVVLFSETLVLPAGYECGGLKKPFFVPDGAPPAAVQAAEFDINGGVPYGTSDIFFGRLEMDWGVADGVTLTSVTGYLDMDAISMDYFARGGILNDMSYGTGLGLDSNTLEQLTQEVRLTTSYDAPVNFMLGVFYEHRDMTRDANQQAVNIGLLAPDPVTGNTSDWLRKQSWDNDAISIFGQVRWDITDRLELSGGVRWTHEKKVARITIPYVHAFLSGGGVFLSSGFDSGDITFKDSNLAPEATLRYLVTEDLNVYASYKTGFKSGGVDSSSLPSSSLLCFVSEDPAELEDCRNQQKYDSETAEGGEIGVKAQFAERSITVNFAAFYYEFTDLQVLNFNPAAIQFTTNNASELTTKGAEIDFSWDTGIEGLSLFGAVAYTNAKFTKPFNPDVASDPANELEGRRTARAPKWSGNIGFDYRTPVGNAFEFGLTGNLQFSSSYFTDNSRLSDHVQSGYALLDLAASIGDADGSWKFAVIGRNITDKRFVNTSVGRPFLASGAIGLPRGDDQVFSLNRGRQIFLEATVTF